MNAHVHLAPLPRVGRKPRADRHIEVAIGRVWMVRWRGNFKAFNSEAGAERFAAAMVRDKLKDLLPENDYGLTEENFTTPTEETWKEVVRQIEEGFNRVADISILEVGVFE